MKYYYTADKLIKEIYQLKDETIKISSDFEQSLLYLSNGAYRSLKKNLKTRNIKIVKDEVKENEKKYIAKK